MGKSFLYGGLAGNIPTANTTEYNWLAGSQSVNATENNRHILFRTAGTLSNFCVRLMTNTVAATSTIRTRKNSNNGGQTVSPGSTATGWFEDTTGTDSISA